MPLIVQLIQRLDIYENFSFWDKFEYLTLLWRYCRIQEEKHILKEKVEELLNLVKYQYYAPINTMHLSGKKITRIEQ